MRMKVWVEQESAADHQWRALVAAGIVLSMANFKGVEVPFGALSIAFSASGPARVTNLVLLR